MLRNLCTRKMFDSRGVLCLRTDYSHWKPKVHCSLDDEKWMKTFELILSFHWHVEESWVAKFLLGSSPQQHTLNSTVYIFPGFKYLIVLTCDYMSFITKRTHI